MQHQEVDLSQEHNQDLVWDLERIAHSDLAQRFIKLFENRLCVYAESTRQLYTNYDLHFPSDTTRKMVVLPNPYAFHDTLHGIEPQAVRKTGLCILPGVVLNQPGLLLTSMIKEGAPAPKAMPFKPALAQIINNQKKSGDAFLPVMIKGDLREFDRRLPYIHLHRLQISRLTRLSSFERDDIQKTITRKLLLLYRQADSLNC